MFFKESYKSDPTSVYNLLRRYGVSESDLKEASDLVKKRAPMLIGEALIELGKVDRDTIDTVLHHQSALRKNSKISYESVEKVVDYATKRTKQTSKSLDNALGLVASVLEKASSK